MCCGVIRYDTQECTSKGRGRQGIISACKKVLCFNTALSSYTLSSSALTCAALRYDTMLYDIIRYDTIRYDTIRYDIIRYDTISYDHIQYAMLCYAMLCYAMLYYTMLCYAMLRVPICTHVHVRAHACEIRSERRDSNAKDNSLIRKEASTSKGFHSTFAAVFSY